jgi:hypothetical protein
MLDQCCHLETLTGFGIFLTVITALELTPLETLLQIHYTLRVTQADKVRIPLAKLSRHFSLVILYMY